MNTLVVQLTTCSIHDAQAALLSISTCSIHEVQAALAHYAKKLPIIVLLNSRTFILLFLYFVPTIATIIPPACDK